MTWFTHIVDHQCPAPCVLAEIGAGTPDRMHFKQQCDEGREVLLVEPGPGFAQLADRFGAHRNVTMLNVAISNEKEVVELWIERDHAKHAYNGHTADYPHHFPHDPKIWYSIKVPAVKFSEIDPGNIDALMLDVEGSEFEVLKTMVSRPKLIAVETRHGDGKHPGSAAIKRWMKDEGYRFIRSHGWDDLYRR